jgi:hypothetical protein
MDNWGTCDFFITTKFMGKDIKTKSVKSQADICPVMQEWWLPI